MLLPIVAVLVLLSACLPASELDAPAVRAVGQPAAGAAPGGAAEQPAPASSPAPAPADLVVWAADRELWAWVLTVAPRIERATGLLVVVSDTDEGVPMFWSTRGTDGGWLGIMHDGPGQADWIAIDPATPLELRETVVLHEVLHALGAEHVGEGAGVLSPKVGKALALSAADLEAVCAVRDCPVFQPEG